MRDALNSNPVVQIAVIGVLVVVVGLFFMQSMKQGSGSSSSSSDTASSAATSPTAPESSAPATTVPVAPVPGSSTAGASSSGGAVAPVTGGTVSPDALIPGPGLPAPVIKAWKGGDAIVLLVVRGGGIDDRLVRGSVQSLSRDRGVSVFVARADGVARYSRITQGVGLDRTPALVLVRPRKESGSVPQAQVRYGFRNSQSVVQAVHDALYHGADNLPYYPR